MIRYSVPIFQRVSSDVLIRIYEFQSIHHHGGVNIRQGCLIDVNVRFIKANPHRTIENIHGLIATV